MGVRMVADCVVDIDRLIEASEVLTEAPSILLRFVVGQVSCETQAEAVELIERVIRDKQKRPPEGSPEGRPTPDFGPDQSSPENTTTGLMSRS